MAWTLRQLRSVTRHPLSQLRLVLLCFRLAGCSGEIGIPSGPGVGARGMEGELPGADADEEALSHFEPAAPVMHRLTVREYQNTLNDLFQEDIALATELEADTALKGFTSIGASELTIAATTAEKLENAALEVTAALFANPERRKALVGCEPDNIEAPCISDFLNRFGRRAFRRSLSGEELSQMRALLVTLNGELNDVWESLGYGVTAFLQSPHFVFRVEVGEPSEEAGRLRYSSLEMASRLSYALWQSMPDEDLLSAGERGELLDAGKVRSQAERLLASPRARTAMLQFLEEHLALDRLNTLSKEVSVFPQMTPTLPASMHGELTRIFEHVALEGGDLRDLLDTRTTFVNGELASLYGIPGVTGDAFTQVELPADGPRAGILSTAGLLAIQATTTNTSPTKRGKFVRNRMLCQEILPPPPGVITVLPPADQTKTMRDRLELHSTDQTCATCHVRMDPIGLAFEHFDGIGAYRDTDRGLPLDVTGDLDGTGFDGPTELANLLRQHDGLGGCFVQQLYRFVTGHQESEAEAVIFAPITRKIEAGGFQLRELLLEVVLSDGFRYASAAP